MAPAARRRERAEVRWRPFPSQHRASAAPGVFRGGSSRGRKGAFCFGSISGTGLFQSNRNRIGPPPPPFLPAVLLGTQTQSFAGTDLRMLLSVGDGFIAAAVSAGANVRV